MNKIPILKPTGKTIPNYVKVFSFTLLTVYVFTLNILPYFTTEHIYLFREDNFWSYESQILRRAAPGQLIWYFNLLTSVGPEVYSVFIFSIFFISVYVLLWRADLRFGSLEGILVIVSPIFLLYSVDSEIILLLPALSLTLRSVRENPFSLVPLILFTSLFREIALILYAPILLTLLMQDYRKLVLNTLASIAALAGVVYMAIGDTQFFLEISYWPNQGIVDLENYGLYNFLDISLPSVLKFHLSGILNGDFPVNLIFWISAAIFFSNICYQRTQSWLFASSFLAIYIICGVLSFDHGRYMYFFFIFIHLMTATQAQAVTVSGSDALGRNINLVPNTSPTILAVFLKSHRVRLAAIAVLVLSPSAYFAAGSFEKPRIVVFFSTIHELGWEIWAPTIPGERFIR